MFQDKLQELGACKEAVAWAGDKTLDEAWAVCERADWMAWLVARVCPKETSVPMVCACARTALKHVPDGEDRPRIAIETAEAYVRGKATLEELYIARRNAYAAYVAYVSFATFASVYTSDYNTDDAVSAAVETAAAEAAAAEAAASAASSAAEDFPTSAAFASATARRLPHLEQCAIIRGMVSVDQIKKGLY